MFTLYSLEDLELFSIRFRKQRKVFTERLNNVSDSTFQVSVQKHILDLPVTVLLKILFRIRLGYTQYDVGISTGKYLGTFLSQTTVSRFESLNLSYRNMLKLRFILEKWMMVRISVTKYNYKPLKPLDCS